MVNCKNKEFDRVCSATTLLAIFVWYINIKYDEKVWATSK
jgi:hypothetical protein